MATYTSEEVKQYLEGSRRINEERKMITQFCRMIAAGIERALSPLGRGAKTYHNEINVSFQGLKPGGWISNFQIEWESKICASGYDVRVWWDGINMLVQGANHLHAHEVMALYDKLPTIMSRVADCFPNDLIPEFQFFINAAKRQ